MIQLPSAIKVTNFIIFALILVAGVIINYLYIGGYDNRSLLHAFFSDDRVVYILLEFLLPFLFCTGVYHLLHLRLGPLSILYLVSVIVMNVPIFPTGSFIHIAYTSYGAPSLLLMVLSLFTLLSFILFSHLRAHMLGTIFLAVCMIAMHSYWGELPRSNTTLLFIACALALLSYLVSTPLGIAMAICYLAYSMDFLSGYNFYDYFYDFYLLCYASAFSLIYIVVFFIDLGPRGRRFSQRKRGGKALSSFRRA